MKNDMRTDTERPDRNEEERNREAELAWEFITKTGTSLFLTGKAGTGKTTFLKRLKKECPKRMVVLAPTGIAAINAGGVTIHSFFQLPFAPHVPEMSFSADGQSKYSYRFGKEKVRLIRSVDLLVIDEISMVRADLLDAVDSVLRKYRDRYKPFGGVQLLMIGDLQQLAPVVKDEERQLLGKYYETPYFFSSMALKQTQFCTIELQKVYRQSDRTFLELLNRIRDNTCDSEVLESLNRRYVPGFKPRKDDGYIRLVTHNHQAQKINSQELAQLKGRSYVFDATVEGKFPEYSYPTDERLELKKGAQVMFVKNDSSGEKRYFNGMIAEVTDISSDMIEVTARDSGMTFGLQQEIWTNARYVLDEESKEIREEIEGTFTQYPVKTAWAITIHKSQGLTFDRAIIDAAASFAHGQTYVALSRCRTLEGLVLSTPLTAKAIISDRAVEQFIGRARDGKPDDTRLGAMRKAYFLELLTDLFDFRQTESLMKRHVRAASEYLDRLFPQQMAEYREQVQMFTTEVTEVAQRFRQQYVRLTDAAADYEADPKLQERIRSAASYFGEKLKGAAETFSTSVTDPDNKEAKKRLKETREEFMTCLRIKTALLDFAAEEGFSTSSYLHKKAVVSLDDGQEKNPKNDGISATETAGKKTAGKKAAGKKKTVPSDIRNPELYERLIAWRNEKAAEQGCPVYVIIHQQAILGICSLLPATKAALSCVAHFGKKSVEKHGEDILRIIRKYRKEKGLDNDDLL